MEKLMKNRISNLLKYLKQFGIKLTILYYIPWHFKEDSSISRKLFKYKHTAIDKYLLKKYKHIVSKYNTLGESDNKISEDATIWILWWQGEENAPEIVKKCIASVVKNRGKHKVILLDSQNITQYIDIPQHILEKYEKGIISMAALSDVIRMKLLAEYGGIWCDATIFMVKEFEKHLYSCKFYGIHMNSEKALYTQCTDAKWSLFLIASSKHGQVVSFCKDILEEYWKNHSIIIDYFLTDYVIRMAYNNISGVKRIIDTIPINNEHYAELLPLLGREFESDIWNEISDGTCFKLSWKEKDIMNIDNENSFYKKIVL